MGDNNSHEHFRDLLIKKLIFNDVTPEEDQKLEEHLLDCTICNEYKNTILLNNKILAEEKIPHHSTGFKSKLMNKIQSMEEISRRKKEFRTTTVKRSAWGLVAAVIPLIILYSLLSIDHIKVIPPGKESSIDMTEEFPMYKGMDKKAYNEIMISRHVKNYLSEQKVEGKKIKTKIAMGPARMSKKSKQSKMSHQRMESIKKIDITIEADPLTALTINENINPIEEQLLIRYPEAQSTISVITIPYEISTALFVLIIAVIMIDMILRIFMTLRIIKSKRKYAPLLCSATILFGILFIIPYAFVMKLARL